MSQLPTGPGKGGDGGKGDGGKGDTDTTTTTQSQSQDGVIASQTENEVSKWKNEEKSNQNAFELIVSSDEEFIATGIKTFAELARTYGTETALVDEHNLKGLKKRRLVLPLLEKLRLIWRM